jgi:phosphatidylglycerol:prolipoprotein diacylglycerol transferase
MTGTSSGTLAQGIPYHSFPEITIGPLTLQTFGIFVAIGILVGIWVAARRNERFGIPREETEKVGFILVGAGLVGARLLWVITHPEEISSPIDVIAVWDGGLQFTGGFVTAILLAPLLTRKWPRGRRWELLDGAILGLAIGQAIGRLGCIAVGEHLGGPTDFFLGINYRGGVVVEGPLEVGVTYHSAALYEALWLVPIILVLLWLDRRGARAGVMSGVFIISYGVLRFLTDFVRINDETLFGLTGAQYMSLILVPFGIWVLSQAFRAPAPEAADDAGDDAPADLDGSGDADGSTDLDDSGDPVTEADVLAGSGQTETTGGGDGEEPDGASDREGTA